MKPWLETPMVRLFHGDALAVLRELPDASVQTCITSPPYWGQRDYGVSGQLGLEATTEAFVANLVNIFREVRRILRDDGVVWLNLGDSYAGSGKGFMADGTVAARGKQATNRGSVSIGADVVKSKRLERGTGCGLPAKNLIGMPWMVAFALQADGWILRSDIIWFKPNPMPESVTDRPTQSHEYLFLLSKQSRYYYDAAAVKEPAEYRTDARPFGLAGDNRHGDEGRVYRNAEAFNGRNKRDVWTVATAQFDGAHFATFPPALVEPCILAGSREGDTVLDPFVGSGTTCEVAARFGRKSIGIDLSEPYLRLAAKRIANVPLPLERAT